MKIFSAVILFLLLVPRIEAQLRVDSLPFLFEKEIIRDQMHLHIDKDVYLPGETIWFKAYILADRKLQSISKNLFTELLDRRGQVMYRFTSPIIDGTSAGQFTLPDTMQSQTLTIRSFTRQMATEDDPQIYIRKIRVIGETGNNEVKPVVETSLQIFSEGGTFVNNVPNIVSFKAVSSNGIPFAVKGVIKDNTGRVLDSINAMHDGMGSFLFVPVEKETYYIEWRDNKNGLRKTSFPAAKNDGIALQVRVRQNDLWYSIQNPFPSGDLSELHLVAKSANRIIYSAKTKVNQLSNPFGSISTKGIPSGIVTVTVFDKQMQPLAERIVFVNNNDFSFSGNIRIHEKNLNKRGKTTIELSLPDSFRQSLSVAVADANLILDKRNDIFSDIFFW